MQHVFTGNNVCSILLTPNNTHCQHAHSTCIPNPPRTLPQSKDISNLQRTVAELEAQRSDLEAQRTDLGSRVDTLQNSLSSTQKELTDALTAEQARVQQLQRTLEQETQAAATAADTAGKEQAALRTKIDVCGWARVLCVGGIVCRESVGRESVGREIMLDMACHASISLHPHHCTCITTITVHVSPPLLSTHHQHNHTSPCRSSPSVVLR